jgi:hypothetical protein
MASYELTVTTDNDASSGVYDSYDEARAAADDAAAIDDLTVDVQHWTKVATETVGSAGTFVDGDGAPWFEFIIAAVES